MKTFQVGAERRGDLHDALCWINHAEEYTKNAKFSESNKNGNEKQRSNTSARGGEYDFKFNRGSTRKLVCCKNLQHKPTQNKPVMDTSILLPAAVVGINNWRLLCILFGSLFRRLATQAFAFDKRRVLCGNRKCPRILNSRISRRRR